jgi:TonB family protein
LDQDVQSILEHRSTRPVRRQQTTAFVAAFIVHALAVGAAFALPRLGDDERKRPEYVEVHVLPAAALGVERPSPRPEPEPPRPDQTPEPEPEPEPPPPEPDPEIPTLPAEQPEPEPRPEPRPQPRPAPQAPAPSRPEPEPSERSGPRGSPTGTPGGAPGLNVQVSGPGGSVFNYDYYLDQMLGKISRGWVPTGQLGLEALITFRVRRNGEIFEIEVEESSGNRPFDRAALRAVRNASPLPPLPTSYREDVLKVDMIVESATMRSVP